MGKHARTAVLVAVLLVVGLIAPSAQTTDAAVIVSRLQRALTAAGVTVDSIAVKDPANKATWKVQPTSQQAAAQPTIDGFDVTAQTWVDGELTDQVVGKLDNERLISAVVWTIIDTYSAPATIAKYQAARTKIISAYKLQPWKP